MAGLHQTVCQFQLPAVICRDKTSGVCYTPTHCPRLPAADPVDCSLTTLPHKDNSTAVVAMSLRLDRPTSVGGLRFNVVTCPITPLFS